MRLTQDTSALKSPKCCGELRFQVLPQLSTEQFHKYFLIRSTTTATHTWLHFTYVCASSVPPREQNVTLAISSVQSARSFIMHCIVRSYTECVFCPQTLRRDALFGLYEWYDELSGLAGPLPVRTPPLWLWPLSFVPWWAMTGSRWCGQSWPHSGVCHGSHSWRWMCKFCRSDTCRHWRNGSQSVCIIWNGCHHQSS